MSGIKVETSVNPEKEDVAKTQSDAPVEKKPRTPRKKQPVGDVKKTTTRTRKPKGTEEVKTTSDDKPKDSLIDDIEKVEVKEEKKEKLINYDEDSLVHSPLNPIKATSQSSYKLVENQSATSLESKYNKDAYPIVLWTRNFNNLVVQANKSIERMNNGEGLANDLAVLKYVDSNAVMKDKYFKSFFTNANGDWSQGLRKDNGRYVANGRASYSGDKIDGNSAKLISAVTRGLQCGVPVIVRLFHSGLVCQIQPLSKETRINLMNQLREGRLHVLRRTNGMIHSTSSYYSDRILKDFFARNTIACNIDLDTFKNEHNSLIDDRDIQLISNGLLMASYQLGYRLIETCGATVPVLDANDKPIIENGKKLTKICTHQHTDMIDFNLLVVCDNSKFTKWQRDFITRPFIQNQPASLDDIKRYQSEGEIHKQRVIEINDNISVIVGPRSIGDKIRMGEKWIESAEKAVEQYIMSDSSEDEREVYIEENIIATQILDIAHIVRGFVVDGRKEVIDPKKSDEDNDKLREAIFEIMKNTTNNLEINERIFQESRKYIADHIGAVCAYPTKKCEECGSLTSDVEGAGSIWYTPIDMVNRFFILTDQSI